MRDAPLGRTACRTLVKPCAAADAAAAADEDDTVPAADLLLVLPSLYAALSTAATSGSTAARQRHCRASPALALPNKLASQARLAGGVAASAAGAAGLKGWRR